MDQHTAGKVNRGTFIWAAVASVIAGIMLLMWNAASSQRDRLTEAYVKMKVAEQRQSVCGVPANTLDPGGVPKRGSKEEACLEGVNFKAREEAKRIANSSY